MRISKMGGKKMSPNYFRFFVYLVVIVLINLVGLTAFFRVDLTENQIYSISEASKQVVSSLSEPLTVKIFFTKNLPAPHNNTERYLHDLLEEYSIYGNRYFNYEFFDVDPDTGELIEQAKENQELARNYGIHPVQIQVIEKDEVKFQRAYMGLALIHGDMIDEIYFSILQRKLLTPNDFPNLEILEQRLLAFQDHYENIAKPFKWKFTKKDLHRILTKLSSDLLQHEKMAA